jgi:hypothetical protein
LRKKDERVKLWKINVERKKRSSENRKGKNLSTQEELGD